MGGNSMRVLEMATRTNMSHAHVCLRDDLLLRVNRLPVSQEWLR